MKKFLEPIEMLLAMIIGIPVIIILAIIYYCTNTTMTFNNFTKKKLKTLHNKIFNKGFK